MAGPPLGTSWWGRAWIDALEAGGAQGGAGIRAGRTLARRGAVHELELRSGHIAARVIGNGGELHDVDIAVRRLAATEWAQVAEAIAGTSGHLAALLDGELPPGVVADAAEVDVAVLVRASDLRPDCSCEEWNEPCRHAAAACYTVAGELDRDPFALFRLRGIERNELIAAVRAARPEQPSSATTGPGSAGRDGTPTGAVAGGPAVGVEDGTDPAATVARTDRRTRTGPEPPAGRAGPDVAGAPERVDGAAAWRGRRIDDDLAPPPAGVRDDVPSGDRLGAEAGERRGGPGPAPRWDAEPPSRHGIDPSRVDDLARDAVERAWSMLVDDRPSGLRSSARADLARRVVTEPERLVDLANLAGVTPERLRAWAQAWSAGDDDAVTVVAEPRSWSDDQDVLAEAREHLVALGLQRRSIALNYDSLRVGPSTWLVCGPGRRWYRLSGQQKHHGLDLAGGPADSVTDLVDPPGDR